MLVLSRKRGEKIVLGDDITVTVLDDGIDIRSSEFQGNIWQNKTELRGHRLFDENHNGACDGGQCRSCAVCQCIGSYSGQ